MSLPRRNRIHILGIGIPYPGQRKQKVHEIHVKLQSSKCIPHFLRTMLGNQEKLSSLRDLSEFHRSLPIHKIMSFLGIDITKIKIW